MIVNNLCLIGAMGFYIATEIEKPYFPGGWETISGETRYFKSKPITWLNDWLVVSGSTLVIYGLTAAILIQQGQFTRKLSLWFFGFSVLLLVADLLYSARILGITNKSNPRFSTSNGI